MSQEIETKVLNVDQNRIRQILRDIGAEKILETRFKVEWFRSKETIDGKDPWFLRIMTDSDGKSEVTLKGKHENVGSSRLVKEISFFVSDTKSVSLLFKGIGLENYAYQEKDRTSWKLNDWKFDLDQYPGMPAYLEIEGKGENHIKEALKLLKVEFLETWSDGERILIEKKYGLDWKNMKFEK